MARHLFLLVSIGLAALSSSPAFAQDTTAAPAPAPAVRIGVVLPRAQLGQSNSGQDVSEPVRQLLMSYMAGPRLELVPLQAKIAAQVDAEAQSQNCTHVLYTSVEQKKAGKGMGGMLGMLGPAASMLPGIGALGGNASMIAGVAAQAVSTAAIQSAQEDAIASLSQAQAGSVRKRDEISLTYQFVTLGGGSRLEETLKAKAEEDGEDLLRPLAEQVATKTVNAALAPQG